MSKPSIFKIHFLKLFLVKAWLTFNVILVSDIHHSDSALICIMKCSPVLSIYHDIPYAVLFNFKGKTTF